MLSSQLAPVSPEPELQSDRSNSLLCTKQIDCTHATAQMLAQKHLYTLAATGGNDRIYKKVLKVRFFCFPLQLIWEEGIVGLNCDSVLKSISLQKVK